MIDVGLDNQPKIEVEVLETDAIDVGIDTPIIQTGSNDYEELNNKPKINGVEVVGEKVSSDYGLQDEITFCTNLDIDKLFR